MLTSVENCWSWIDNLLSTCSMGHNNKHHFLYTPWSCQSPVVCIHAMLMANKINNYFLHSCMELPAMMKLKYRQILWRKYTFYFLLWWQHLSPTLDEDQELSECRLTYKQGCPFYIRTLKFYYAQRQLMYIF